MPRSGYDNSGSQAHLRQYLENPEQAQFIYPHGKDKPVTTLLLTTTGRKSGQPRTTPLIYKKVDKAYVIVASLGGNPEHPLWYLNLEAAPDCVIQVGRETLKVKARTVPDGERERLWAEAVMQYPDYNEYQARTQRKIPVVALEPVPAPD
jgi:deazaflavin-dependent oxidoreductase (nitroreductase family)